MDINNRVGIHNRFDIEVIDSKTGKVKQKAKAFNVICNRLWSRLITFSGGSGYYTYIHYGSGSGTPAASDTSLFHFEGYKQITTSYDSYSSDFKNGIASLRRKVILDENTANGVTITEVGIADGGSAGNLCTHAMLQDMNGNVISIQKTNTDIINIYATVFLHWDNTGDIKLTNLGVAMRSYGPYVIRQWLFGLEAMTNGCQKYPMFMACYKEAYKGNLPYANTSQHQYDVPMYSGSGAATATMDTANKTFRATFQRIPATDVNNAYVNDGGIGRICLMTNNEYESSSSYNYNTDPYGPIEIESGGNTIPPSRIVGETIGTGDGTKTKFATKFDFPYNAVVYVNGVAVNTGVTIKKLPRKSNKYFHNYVVKLSPQSDETNKIPIAGVSRSNYGYSMQDDYFGVSYSDSNYPFENKCNEVGIEQIYVNNTNGIRAFISDDLENWEEILGNGWVTLPENKQHYKFFKCVIPYSSSCDIKFNVYDGYNVIFDTPPAVGDVITIDYTTPYIPKDENHVFDLSFSITFGEWTGE